MSLTYCNDTYFAVRQNAGRMGYLALFSNPPQNPGAFTIKAQMNPVITIYGKAGYQYALLYSAHVNGPWNMLDTIVLPTDTYQYIDNAVPYSNKYYKAELIQ